MCEMEIGVYNSESGSETPNSFSVFERWEVG